MQTTLTRIEVANFQDLPVKVGKVIKIEDQEIVLFRLTNGEVKAVANKSPHPKGGPLADGLISGTYVFCPLYDWKISLLDGLVQAPDEGQVKIFPVEVTDQRVFIIV